MKVFVSEKNLVAVLFVMVLITFSLAQEDTKKMEKGLAGYSAAAASRIMADQPVTKDPVQAAENLQ